MENAQENNNVQDKIGKKAENNPPIQPDQAQPNEKDAQDSSDNEVESLKAQLLQKELR